jgi:hypothetical protein
VEGVAFMSQMSRSALRGKGYLNAWTSVKGWHSAHQVMQGFNGRQEEAGASAHEAHGGREALHPELEVQQRRRQALEGLFVLRAE